MFDNLPFLRFSFSFIQTLLGMPSVSAGEVLAAIRYAYDEGIEEGMVRNNDARYNAGYEEAKRVFGPRSFVPTYSARHFLQGTLAAYGKSHFVFDEADVTTLFWDYMQKRQKISAIKELRTYTDMGLKDSKDVVDTLDHYMHPELS